MAGEFTKRTEDGQNIWTCVICNMDIVSAAKPRRHECAHSSSGPETSTTTTPVTTGSRVPTPMKLSTPSRQLGPSQNQNIPLHSHFRFSTPPPGFPAPQNPRIQNVRGQSEVSALSRFKCYSQNKPSRWWCLCSNKTRRWWTCRKNRLNFKWIGW